MTDHNLPHLQMCNMCGSRSRHKFLMRKHDPTKGQPTAELFRCVTCKGVFLGDIPRSFNDDLYSYYERYRTMGRDEVYSQLTRSRYFGLLDRLETLTAGRTFMDVGCGLGSFVDAAVARGWRGTGIDLADVAIEIGQSFGVPIRKTDLFSSDITQESFHVVTMFEFIEHVPNPGLFLSRAEQLLKPGGILYLTTPNFNSVDRLMLKEKWKAVHVEHFSYFTPRSLLHLVGQSTSLQLVDLKTKNVSAELLRNILRCNAASTTVAQHQYRDNLRHEIEASRALTGIKGAVNSILNITRLGSSMTLTLKRLDV